MLLYFNVVTVSAICLQGEVQCLLFVLQLICLKSFIQPDRQISQSHSKESKWTIHKYPTNWHLFMQIPGRKLMINTYINRYLSQIIDLCWPVNITKILFPMLGCCFSLLSICNSHKSVLEYICVKTDGCTQVLFISDKEGHVGIVGTCEVLWLSPSISNLPPIYLIFLKSILVYNFSSFWTFHAV